MVGWQPLHTPTGRASQEPGPQPAPRALWLDGCEGVGWAQFAEWCNGRRRALGGAAVPGLCQAGILPSGPLPGSRRSVGTLGLRLRTFPKIDKVQGLRSASRGIGLTADQWGAGSPGRVCWEERAPDFHCAPPTPPRPGPSVWISEGRAGAPARRP